MLGELARLEKRQHFPEFIHGAEAAGKNDEGFGDLREPEFAHEEIMEIKAELGADVSVGKLLVRQLDGKADRLAARFTGTAIGGFHNAGTSTGADDEAARPGSEREGPGRDFVGEFASFLVVAGHFEETLGVAQFTAMARPGRGGQLFDVFVFQPSDAGLRSFVRLDAGGAEHDDGVGDSFLFQLDEGMEVFRENAQGPRGRTLEEMRILMGRMGRVLGLELGMSCGHGVSLQKMQTIIVGIAEARGNVFRRECVELSTLRELGPLCRETE